MPDELSIIDLSSTPLFEGKGKKNGIYEVFAFIKVF